MRITALIFAFILTAALIIPAAFFSFAFMLVAMNGYMNADVGVTAFMIWTVIVCLGSALASVLSAYLLERKKKINVFGAALLATLLFVIIGSVLAALGILVGIGAQEIYRNVF